MLPPVPDDIPARQVRALYDGDTITVYQAYSSSIAEPALRAGRFVPPFSRTRMTWIKPSFLWMMYRSGWATKPGQERVLAIRLLRSGFDEALASACLSSFDPAVYPTYEAWRSAKTTSPVRVQWDPERNVRSAPLRHRSIQVGIGPRMVPSYVDDWIVDITDVTDLASELRGSERIDLSRLPREAPYPLAAATAVRLGASSAVPTSGPGSG